MLAARISELALRFPRALAAAVAALTALLGLGALQLRSASYLEGHLPAGDSRLAAHRQLEERFGGDRLAVFAIGCGEPAACRDVFEPAPLGLLQRLDGLASGFPGVEEVQSLASAGALSGQGGTLSLVHLDPALAPDAVHRFRELVERDLVLQGTLVSRDLRTAVLAVRFDSRRPDAEVNATALDMDLRLAAEASAAGFELFASGVVLLAASADAYVRHDLATLTPAMVLLLAGLLIWILRSALATGLAIFVVALPVVWAFGLMGWIGRPVTPVSSTLPILILVVGITDALHFLVRVRELTPARGSARDAILEVAREVGVPTTVTAVTSALGFLSFLAGPLPNLRDYGLFAAVGILGAWLLTFTLVPIALARWPGALPREAPPLFALGDRALAGIRGLAQRHGGLVVGLAALVALASLVGIARLRAETDGLALRGEGDRFVRSERFLRERVRPTDSLEVMVQLPDGAALESLSTLEDVEAIEGALVELTRGDVTSVLAPLRVAQREMAGGEARLPESPEAAAQLLLLLEAADPGALGRVLTADRRVVRLSAPYASSTSDSIRSDTERVRQALSERFGADGAWTITGSVVLLSHLADLVLANQTASFSTAFVTIFVVIFAVVRSFSLGLLGMLPNVLPVIAILGLMGASDIHLDVGTAMIASIVLGVSVDDTIYFLLHYKRARSQGAGVRDAVAYTLAIAGKPALFCSAVLALGFFVLAFSSFQTLAIFGLLSGFAVLLAGASELFVLPALLELAARHEGSG